jgi:hypothetical protein
MMQLGGREADRIIYNIQFRDDKKNLDKREAIWLDTPNGVEEAGVKLSTKKMNLLSIFRRVQHVLRFRSLDMAPFSKFLKTK